MLTLLFSALLSSAPGALQAEVDAVTPDTVTAGQPAAVAPRGASGQRTLTISRAAGPIRVDGNLDDPGWEGAARTRGFTEMRPREGHPAPVETEVLATYDGTHVYFAFIAHDPDPSRIRATLQQRDQIFSDDFVGVMLDTHGDANLGYYFFASALGVQGDAQVSPNNEDWSIDFVYQTAGRITGTGYIVEMAIPFSSLRFPNRPVQEWRITFARSYPRSSQHQFSWSPLSMDNPCVMCQLGYLQGIEGITAGGTLEILPAVVASQAGRLSTPGDPSSFEQGSVSASASLGAKYVFRSGWMAEGTVNPDFSQVESDAAQVDVNTTFALFYPERRPFFQEGMDLYDTRMNVFYSRSINAPQAAAKVAGRQGRTSFGYIGARDEHTPFILPFEERSVVLQAGPSTTNVVRLRHNVYGDSHVGALLADRRMDGGGSGTTVSADASLRFATNYRFAAHLVGSHTAEPDDPTLSARIPNIGFGRGDDSYTAAFDGEEFSGHAASLLLARNARTWSWNVGYSEASPTYRADAGFQSRNDFRRTTGWTGVTLHPNRHGVERLSGGVGVGSSWNFEGTGKEAWVNPSLSVALPRQTHVGIGTNLRRETFRDVEMEGLTRYTINVNSAFSDLMSAGFFVGTGRSVARMFATPEVGRGTDAMLWATIRPLQRLVIEPSLTYAELNRLDGEEIYSGYIARTRVGFQYNRELQLRVVLQYNEFDERLDVEPLLVYQVNPFTMFYVGSTYGSHAFDEVGRRNTDRQYFAKFQYLFRR
jgi:hypothetical protein